MSSIHTLVGHLTGESFTGYHYTDIKNFGEELARVREFVLGIDPNRATTVMNERILDAIQADENVENRIRIALHQDKPDHILDAGDWILKPDHTKPHQSSLMVVPGSDIHEFYRVVGEVQRWVVPARPVAKTEEQGVREDLERVMSDAMDNAKGLDTIYESLSHAIYLAGYRRKF